MGIMGVSMRRGLRTLGVTSHRSGWKGLHALILLMFLWPGWSEGTVSSKATRLSCEALNGTEVKPFHYNGPSFSRELGWVRSLETKCAHLVRGVWG